MTDHPNLKPEDRALIERLEVTVLEMDGIIRGSQSPTPYTMNNVRSILARVIAETKEVLDAARQEGRCSPGEDRFDGLPERVTDQCADAGPCPHSQSPIGWLWRWKKEAMGLHRHSLKTAPWHFTEDADLGDQTLKDIKPLCDRPLLAGSDLWQIMMALTTGDPDFRVTRTLETISSISARRRDGGEAVHTGQLRDDQSSSPQPSTKPPADVVRLVIAARGVAFEDHPSPEALRELDQSSEAFADRVPWENQEGSDA